MVATLCAHCQQRPGTVDWVGDGGTLAMTHGWSVRWCERCCVEAQLAYARERAASIPNLEQRLQALVEGDNKPTDQPVDVRGTEAQS